MENTELFDELDTLILCQEALIEFLSSVPEGICSTHKLAVLLHYLQSQQVSLIEALKR